VPEENAEGNQDSEEELEHEFTVLTRRNAGFAPPRGVPRKPIDFTIRRCIVYPQLCFLNVNVFFISAYSQSFVLYALELKGEQIALRTLVTSPLVSGT
jgi:hypothetical protein